MDIELREESMEALEAHLRIPIAFEVRSILEVTVVNHGLGGFVLSERPVVPPYVKNYDAVEGEGPASWADRFDTSHWGLVSAYVHGRRAGGAVIALNTPVLHMLEGRRDLAALWDIRVRPEWRGQAVGSALFHDAEQWAGAKGCRGLKIETQNINVPACRFYARQGCVLEGINRFAYEQFPDETQLIWQKQLAPPQ